MQAYNSSFNQGYAGFYDLFYKNKNYKRELDFIKKVLQVHKMDLSNKHILEIGCGSGNFSYILQSNNLLTAIDPSSEMIKIAKKKFSYMQNNFQQLTIADFNLLENHIEQFDVIILLFHVFSYLSSTEIEELKVLVQKHLNKGGVLIFDYWDKLGVDKAPPTITTKQIIYEDSVMLRTAKPLTISKFDNYNEFAIEIIISEIKLGESARVCVSETHYLRAYDSKYIDKVMTNLNCVGNIDLFTGENYQGENYGNCKFFLK